MLKHRRRRCRKVLRRDCADNRRTSLVRVAEPDADVFVGNRFAIGQTSNDSNAATLQKNELPNLNIHSDYFVLVLIGGVADRITEQALTTRG